MLEEIEKTLKIENDKNFDILKRNYNDGILNKSSLYNILKKEYVFDDNMDLKIKKVLNIEFIKTNSDEKISIIIPTYNRKEQLKECVDSILSQTYYNFEIIIVDDCSTDGTEEYIKNNFDDKRVLYVKNSKNSGAGFSRKNGYSRSTGEYVIFCDDDDYYVDNYFFEDAINILKNNEISLVCSNSYIKYESENRYYLNKLNFKNIIPTKEYLENIQIKYIKPNSTFSTIFRKSILEKSKISNMIMVNDSAIYMRALLNGNKVYVNEKIIGIYRIHSQNISFNIKADFLIQNLEEKEYIYNELQKENLNFDINKWFQNHIKLTVYYFFNGTNPSKSERKKVIEWIKKKASRKIVFEIYLMNIKIKIKKIIKN